MHGSRVSYWPLMLLMLSVTGMAWAQKPAPIDWAGLKNPVLAYPDWSIKDADMAWHGEWCYLFFSAFYQDRGEIRSHVVSVRTRDFKSFSSPLWNIDGREGGWIGLCSPSLAQVGDTWYLCLNSWGDKKGQPNQLFYMTSTDLENWSLPRPLAANLTRGNRAIDAALAHDGKRFMLFWKERIDGKDKTRLAWSETMDGEFAWVGDGCPKFILADGKESPNIQENYDFLKIDGRWHLLLTDYRPAVHHPVLLTMRAGDGSHDADWLTWEGRRIDVAVEELNTRHPANAAALLDWREREGFFYLLYAGNTEGESYKKRGHNRLFLSRSKDLLEWLPAGSGQ